MWVISYQYVFKICHFNIVEPLIVVLSLSIKTSDSNAYLVQTCVCLKYENSTIVTFNEIALYTMVSCVNGWAFILLSINYMT